MMGRTLYAIALVVAAGGALSAPAFSCTRDTLRAATERYMAAQAAGKPATLLELAGSPPGPVDYTEDGLVRDLQKGILSTPLRIDHNRSDLDTTQCATYTELISTDEARPHVIGTQMRFNVTTGLLARVESLVTQAGDWAFNASRTLAYAQREDGHWGPQGGNETADARLARRDVIQAAADAYLDLFNNKSVVVPWGSPCNRLEGSMYTGNGSATDSCNVGVPSGIVIKDRRYVIDETVGVVDCLVKFSTRPDSHEFRVENGRIRFVHTLTIMRNLTG